MLGPALYQPTDSEAEKIKDAQEKLEIDLENQAVYEQDMNDIGMGGLGIAVFIIFCIWAALSFFSIACVHIRWCRVPTTKPSNTTDQVKSD